MHAALRRIPVEQQIAIELYYLEDLTMAEVADVLGVPPGTIRSRLSRARRNLETALAAGNGGALPSDLRSVGHASASPWQR